MTQRTIREYIITAEANNLEKRIERLKEIGAPQLMVAKAEGQLAELRQGNIKIGGEVELLNETFEHYEVKKGTGGRVYIEFDTVARYFPEAKYGKFITQY